MQEQATCTCSERGQIALLMPEVTVEIPADAYRAISDQLGVCNAGPRLVARLVGGSTG